MKTNPKWSMGIGLLIAVLLAFTAFADEPTVPDEIVKDRENFIPRPKRQPLPGKAVGILLTNAGLINHSKPINPTQQLFLFSTADSGFGEEYEVYVQKPEKPLIPSLQMTSQDGKITKHFTNLNFANLENCKQWDLHEPYSLVEVEVNGGMGSGGTTPQHFVLTNLKVLDGTVDYPIKVSKVIVDLRESYRQYLKDQQKAVDEAMGKGQAEASKLEPKPTVKEPRSTKEVMYVTWLPDVEKLRVCFRTQMGEAMYHYFNEYRPPRGEVNQNTTIIWTVGARFGLEIGKAYEVSKAGQLQKTRTLPIKAYTEKVFGSH